MLANNEFGKKKEVNIYRVKTLDIMNTMIQLKRVYKRRSFLFRLFNDKTWGEKKLELFLDTVPISSNYLMEQSFFGFDKKL
jgi:hypothetical protein